MASTAGRWNASGRISGYRTISSGSDPSAGVPSGSCAKPGARTDDLSRRTGSSVHHVDAQGATVACQYVAAAAVVDSGAATYGVDFTGRFAESRSRDAPQSACRSGGHGTKGFDAQAFDWGRRRPCVELDNYEINDLRPLDNDA